jgi:hypothetical protein
LLSCGETRLLLSELPREIVSHSAQINRILWGKCIALLRQLLVELGDRKALPAAGPRVLVTGSVIDNPVLFRMIEEEGGPADLFTAPRSERLRQFLSSHLRA